MLSVSVVIPTYNRAHLIGRAIQSALENVVAGDEILVVDDASTDHTIDVVKAFGPPVRLICAEHGGAGKARNRGIQEARGDLVAFLDSDDEWFPDKLQLQRAFFERRPDVLYSFSDFRSKEDSGVEEACFLHHWHKDSRSWDEILAPGMHYSTIAPLPPERADFRVHVGNMFLNELWSDYIATTTVVVRRLAAGDALSFAEDLPTSEDKECFAKLAGRGLGAYFDTELSVQWGHAGPRLTDTKTDVVVACRLKLFERIWERDAAFMARHGDELRKARAAQHLKRAKWLLRRGRMEEARADLRAAGMSPLRFRLLAAIPGPVARTLLATGRHLKFRAAAT